MYRNILIATTLLSLGVPSIAFSQDARAILETTRDRQLARWKGVETYVVEQETMGTATRTYFRRSEIQAGDSLPQIAFLPVSTGGLGKCVSSLDGADFATTYNFRTVDKYAESARLIGTETVDGRPAYRLHIDDIEQVQPAAGGEYRMKSLDLWIDAQEYVPLRMKLEGSVISGEETRPVGIEVIQTDYRSVPGSEMYESFKQSVQIAGAMDPAQEAQMREAQAKMAELEKRLETMPEGQRAMMERMIGSQIEMMKSMASGGGIQMDIVTRSIVVNPAMDLADDRPCPTIQASSILPPGLKAPASSSASVAARAPVPGPTALEAAQQACLRQKVAEAQTKQKRKRGFRSLLKVARRAAGRFGDAELARVTRDIYDVDATAADLALAAKEMGLTEDDVAACRTPQ